MDRPGETEGRARTRTPPRGRGDPEEEASPHPPTDHDPAWEAPQRQRLFRELDRCWHDIQVNRTMGQPLTRQDYTWSAGVNCLIWTTCTPDGRRELQAFLRERGMDERGMQALASWWEGLRINTIAEAHELLLEETSVRSYVGTVRGDYHQYLAVPVHHAPYAYLDREVQEHIMQLADPHNWLQSCFLLAPRSPGEPLPLNGPDVNPWHRWKRMRCWREGFTWASRGQEEAGL